MSQRRTALANLHEELRNIQIFDRVYDYSSDADAANELAHVVRQMRRKQIVDEIARLRAAKGEPAKRKLVGSVLVIMCAFGYGMLYYLLR
jgi:hypothetical protein